MARPRKGQNTKTATTATTGATPDAFAAAISEAVAQALEPISQKLDNMISSKSAEEIKVDDATLTLMGVTSAQELGDVMEEAAELAADTLEQSGSPIAAAVVDAGLDTAAVVNELVKGRKARKAAGETLAPVTPEEVAEVIETVAEEVADDLSDEEVQQLADDGFVDETAVEGKEEDEPPSGAKRRGKPKTRGTKSQHSTARQTQRATAPPIQRKYSQFFGMASKESNMQREQKELPPVVRLARAVKCADFYARGGISGGFADPERAAWAAQKFYKDANLAREFKSMSITDSGSAGILVPQDYLGDIIEMLYNNTVLFELGARKIPMPRGNLSIMRQTSGARARFGGEKRKINPSEPGFSQLNLTARRLQAIVISTEELLRSTDISADQIFGTDLLTQMKLGIEWGGLLGDGVEFNPLGLLHNPKVESIDLLTINDRLLADEQGRPTADIPIFAKGKVRGKNVVGNSFGWTMNSDAEQFFQRMKAADGTFLWKSEMDKGTFNGDPYRVTNMIETDFSKGTTSMFFGNWSDFLVGEQFGLETRTTYDATIETDGGTVNTFQEVQTATRATAYVDMGNRHDESFIKVVNIKVKG